MTNVSGQQGPRLECEVLESGDDRLLSNPQLLINAVQSVATKRSLLRLGGYNIQVATDHQPVHEEKFPFKSQHSKVSAEEESG